jgi:hypothetical protein
VYIYFDINKIIKQSRLPDNIIERLKQEIRMEFPADDLMYELHLMRSIKAESGERSLGQLPRPDGRSLR